MFEKYEIITESKYFRIGKKTFFVKATQNYVPKADIGHYRYVILHVPYGGCLIDDGNIVGSGYSCCGAPKGKLNKVLIKEIFNSFYKDWEFDKKQYPNDIFS